MTDVEYMGSGRDTHAEDEWVPCRMSQLQL